MEKKHSMLLAEDEALVRNSLPVWLGYEVATAGDGERHGKLPVEELRAKPGPERPCIYMLTGEVSYRLCSHLYGCHNCSFNEQVLDGVKH
jgi:hypothetical protein